MGLKRKLQVGDRIKIGDDITISFQRYHSETGKNGPVYIWIEAPKHIKIKPDDGRKDYLASLDGADKFNV